jgi:hypothetical protein
MMRREGRLKRAHYWFGRMRQIVDGALDRDPAPPARPEQTWLPEVSSRNKH